MINCDLRNFCEIKDVFESAWGILENFWKEAETAAFGKQEEVFKKALSSQFMDIKEVAKYLRCSVSKIRKDSGYIRIIKLNNKHWYFRNDVKTFAKDQANESN